MEDESLTLEIDETASTPKYKQIVNSIISRIEAGKIIYGQKLPSINRLSIDYLLARDTVEKAYNELKNRGIIDSVKGKGYYVRNSNPGTKLRVLVLFNKLSSYKKVIYNTMAQFMGEKAELDLFIYHCNYELFEKIFNERIIGYNYYVIMPHFIEYEVRDFKQLLGKIPKEKIIMLDHRIEGLDYFGGQIYQEFKMDIYDALVEVLDLLKKYEKIELVFPENQNYPYPKDIILGFRRFCSFHGMNSDIVSEIRLDSVPEDKTAYIIIEENDLVNMIKLARQHELVFGKDLGILSYNDTPLKEVLEDGISVITTDFEKMGTLAGKMMTEKKSINIKNDFKVIVRNSL